MSESVKCKVGAGSSAGFRDGWLTINRVPSHVLTWGGWVEDPLPEGDSILVFMCGVPGITLFYYQFLELLYNSLGIPVWTVCTAGQELPPKSSNLELVKDTSFYNTVRGQADHKMAFIERYVPKNRKIYFVAHSFGAKMLVELIKNEQIKGQVDKAILLMPLVERFRHAPLTQFWLTVANTGLIHVLVLFVNVLQYLPWSWRKQACQLYFRLRGMTTVHDSYLRGLDQMLHPKVINNISCLFYDELDNIKYLDTEVIAGVTDKLKIYFAPNDKWASRTHYETLKSAVPELNIELLGDKFIHAFSLNTSNEMAEIIVKDLNIH